MTKDPMEVFVETFIAAFITIAAAFFIFTALVIGITTQVCVNQADTQKELQQCSEMYESE